MLLTIEKVLILKSVGIFSSVPEQQLVDLATVVQSVEFNEGELIVEQGELGTSLFVVVDGKLRVFEGDTELRTYESRDVFGEMSALDPQPRAASVEALTDCSLLRLHGETLYELMASNKELTRGIIHVLCDYARTNLALARGNL